MQKLHSLLQKLVREPISLIMQYGRDIGRWRNECYGSLVLFTSMSLALNSAELKI